MSLNDDIKMIQEQQKKIAADKKATEELIASQSAAFHAKAAPLVKTAREQLKRTAEHLNQYGRALDVVDDTDAVFSMVLHGAAQPNEITITYTGQQVSLSAPRYSQTMSRADDLDFFDTHLAEATTALTKRLKEHLGVEG